MMIFLILALGCRPKIYYNFSSEIVKNCCVLHRRVNVMSEKRNLFEPSDDRLLYAIFK